MRVITAVCALAGLVLLPTAAMAQGPAPRSEAEALRQELEGMRQQFETMRQEYQKAIDAMSERLQRLEAKPQTAAVQPMVAQTPPATTPAPGGQPTIRDLLTPRQPFSLATGRGGGALLFDFGVAGDFVATVTSRQAERTGTGTFAGRENRLFPREIELSLFGQVDPYAYAEVRIETGEEERGGELGMNLAEAAVTLLALPGGLQAKFGQMRNRFGYSNQIHAHDLPWVDVPNAFRNFLGEEGLVERGAEVTLVPDLPFFLEALVGVFGGDNEEAFGRTSLRSPLVTGRLRTFLELSDASALQVGVSGATGETPERHRSTVLGLDARYKYRPDGWLHPLVTVTGEALYSLRTVNVDADGDGTTDFTRHPDRFGFYLGAEVQPFRRWAGGVRYDYSEFPVAAGSEWSIEPYVSFWPSEFLRFRLAYKRTERSVAAVEALGGSGSLNEVFLQGTFILGAHPAHPF
jgi:hypothetical protein